MPFKKIVMNTLGRQQQISHAKVPKITPFT